MIYEIHEEKNNFTCQNKTWFSIEDMVFQNHKQELYLWRYGSMILKSGYFASLREAHKVHWFHKHKYINWRYVSS